MSRQQDGWQTEPATQIRWGLGYIQNRYGGCETEGMTFPARCCHCRRVYDLAKVTVTARYTDCSMWKAPCCGVLADDRQGWIRHYEELRHQRDV